MKQHTPDKKKMMGNRIPEWLIKRCDMQSHYEHKTRNEWLQDVLEAATKNFKDIIS